jgi:hypothetical protein
VSVSYSMLPPCPRDIGESVNTIVSRMASHLEEGIQSLVMPATIHHD